MNLISELYGKDILVSLINFTWRLAFGYDFRSGISFI